MTILTDDIIRQRLRTCSYALDAITKINITGRDLEDVSLIRKMTAIEVLSLSVNKISTLSDFQFCKCLKELYLRKNNIMSLNEIYYLKDLQYLTILGLSQNPCSSDPLYRLTVIKNLLKLEKLDDVPVVPEERAEAFKKGKKIYNPKDVMMGDEEVESKYMPKTPEPKERSLNKDIMKNEQPDIPFILRENQGSPIGKRNADIYEAYNQQSMIIPNRCPETANNAERNMEIVDTNCSYGNPSKESNLLSGILILIKDLDHASLEFLCAKIKGRLNEFQASRYY